MFELLEQSPKNNLELLLLNTEDEISTNHTTSASGIKALSRDTFEAINEIESRCLQQLDVNSQQGQAFWQKIRELWSRLSADEEMMQIFAQVHRPLTSDRCDEVYKPSVLKGVSNYFMISNVFFVASESSLIVTVICSFSFKRNLSD